MKRKFVLQGLQSCKMSLSDFNVKLLKRITLSSFLLLVQNERKKHPKYLNGESQNIFTRHDLVPCFVYQQNISIFLDTLYKNIGCFHNQRPRTITIIKFSPATSINKCYERAKSLGNSFFAVYNQYYCYTSKNAERTWNRNGPTDGCIRGRGGDHKMSAYKILHPRMCNFILLNNKNGIFCENHRRAYFTKCRYHLSCYV